MVLQQGESRISSVHPKSERFGMNDHLPYQANPETRGTEQVQFFESHGDAPQPGTKATPRPAGRHRELPPGSPSPPACQILESKERSGAQGATAEPQPGDRERGGA